MQSKKIAPSNDGIAKLFSDFVLENSKTLPPECFDDVIKTSIHLFHRPSDNSARNENKMLSTFLRDNSERLTIKHYQIILESYFARNDLFDVIFQNLGLTATSIPEQKCFEHFILENSDLTNRLLLDLTTTTKMSSKTTTTIFDKIIW